MLYIFYLYWDSVHKNNQDMTSPEFTCSNMYTNSFKKMNSKYKRLKIYQQLQDVEKLAHLSKPDSFKSFIKKNSLTF